MPRAKQRQKTSAESQGGRQKGHKQESVIKGVGEEGGGGQNKGEKKTEGNIKVKDMKRDKEHKQLMSNCNY